MTSPTYSARSAAIRAARAALQQPGKPAPLSGVHFTVTEVGDRFGWKATELSLCAINSTAPMDTGDFDAGDLAAIVERGAREAGADEGEAADLAKRAAKQEKKAARKRTPQVAPLPGMAPLGIARPKADEIGTIIGDIQAQAAVDAAKASWAQPAPEKGGGKRAAALAAAQRGEIPSAPDFSAETHKRFRAKLAEVEALVEAGDIAGLKTFEINPVSTSPKAIARFRDLAVIALEARA
jgi:hypothetical protein